MIGSLKLPPLSTTYNLSDAVFNPSGNVTLATSVVAPPENVPPVKTGIVLKTGTRYCVEKGASEMAPAILVQYSDGSSVEAVGKVEGS